MPTPSRPLPGGLSFGEKERDAGREASGARPQIQSALSIDVKCDYTDNPPKKRTEGARLHYRLTSIDIQGLLEISLPGMHSATESVGWFRQPVSSGSCDRKMQLEIPILLLLSAVV